MHAGILSHHLCSSRTAQDEKQNHTHIHADEFDIFMGNYTLTCRTETRQQYH